LYTDVGMYLLPLKGKNPGAALGKGWERMATNDPAKMYAHLSAGQRNIGVYLPQSKLACLDIDNRDGLGEMRRSYFEALGVSFTTGLVQRSGSGGYGVYFKNPDVLDTRDVDTGIGEGANARTEFRSNGQQVLPPSIHPDTGTEYTWESCDDPADLPEWATTRKATTGSTGDHAGRKLSPEIGDGNYNNAFWSRICADWERGDAGPDELFVMYNALDQAHDEPMGPETIRSMVERATTQYKRGKWQPSEPMPQPDELPEPVAIGRPFAELLDETEAVLRRHVIMSEAEYVASTLWIGHTHAFSAWDTTPYLWITSPTRECGKSRLLEVMSALVPRPMSGLAATGPVLYREIDERCPTVFFDEADNTLASKGGSERQADVLAILNAGYRRMNSTVPRLVPAGKGKFEARHFRTFCPKAIAGIRDIPDTTASRCVPIRMRRMLPSEQIADFRQRNIVELAPLGDRLASTLGHHVEPLRNTLLWLWADGRVVSVTHEPGDDEARAKALEAYGPFVLDGVSGRDADCWEPLLVTASFAMIEGHSVWLARARKAMATILGAGDLMPENEDDRILPDCRRAFAVGNNPDAMTAGQIIAELVKDDEASWADYGGRGQLTPKMLGRLLKPYGVESVRDLLGRNQRGYRRADFQDAWDRWDASDESDASDAQEEACDGDSSSDYERDGWVE
jgi:hypothetical protein